MNNQQLRKLALEMKLAHDAYRSAALALDEVDRMSTSWEEVQKLLTRRDQCLKVLQDLFQNHGDVVAEKLLAMCG